MELCLIYVVTHEKPKLTVGQTFNNAHDFQKEGRIMGTELKAADVPLLSLARHFIVGQKLTLLQTLTANWDQYNHLSIYLPYFSEECGTQQNHAYLQPEN
jgi:hypothetical protein